MLESGAGMPATTAERPSAPKEDHLGELNNIASRIEILEATLRDIGWALKGQPEQKEPSGSDPTVEIDGFWPITKQVTVDIKEHLVACERMAADIYEQFANN